MPITMEHEDLAETIIEKLRSINGVSHAEVRIETIQMASITISNGTVENASSGITSGIGVRILKDGAWGFAHGPLTMHDEIIQMALNVNRLSARTRNKPISLAEVKPVEDEVVVHQKKSLIGASLEDKITWCMEADANQQHERIKSRTTRYRETIKNTLLCTSEGTKIQFGIPYLHVSCKSVAKEGEKMTEYYTRVGHQGGLELFDHQTPADLGSLARERAIEALGLPSVKQGKYPAVFDGTVNHLFAHEACGHPAEADTIEVGGLLKGKLGKKIASPIVDLVDDGSLSIANGVTTFGYIKYDDEGVPASRTYIIKNGILQSYLTDRSTAREFNLTPSGNARAMSFAFPPIVRMTNTYITTSHPMPEDELLELVKNGFFLSLGAGGQTDPMKGTFNFGVSDIYEIKNGELGQKYAPTTMAGNTLTTLKNIIGISNAVDNPLMSVGFCGKSEQSVPVGVSGGWIAVKQIIVG